MMDDIQIVETTQEQHMQIEGPTALVTGAARGIGRAPAAAPIAPEHGAEVAS